MKRLFHFSLMLLAAVSFWLPMTAGTVMAKNTLVPQSQCQPDSDPNTCIPPPKQDPATIDNCQDNNCDLFIRYVNPLITNLSALAGLAAVVGIIIGGIQYASSGGDPQKAASGKRHIVMAVLAMIVFFFLYAIMKFLFAGSEVK